MAFTKYTAPIIDDIIPINSNWFEPQKLYSCFFGNYALKQDGQNIIQAGFQIGLDTLTNQIFDGEQSTLTKDLMLNQPRFH